MYLKMDSFSFDIVKFLRGWYNFVMGYFEYFWSILQDYGWQIVFFSFVLYYVFKNFVRPLLERSFGSYENYRKTKKEQEYAAKYHKNPDLFAERISAQQNAVQKLQEKYNKEAEEYLRKQEEKNAQKREEMLQELDNKMGGHRLGTGAAEDTTTKNNKSFRPDYNPLMGPGGSSGYRPPKRSACSRGGCG